MSRPSKGRLVRPLVSNGERGCNNDTALGTATRRAAVSLSASRRRTSTGATTTLPTVLSGA
jgi:hypothetical protein